jgi:molybdopterin converting factor small subunit
MAAVRVRIPPLLYSYTGGGKLFEIEAETAGGAIAALDRKFPGLAFRLIDEQNQIRPHINIFLGDESIRDLNTPITRAIEIFIVGALSGG